MRLPALFLLVLLISPALGAQTVMLSLENDAGDEYIVAERLDFASAVEDGAMDVFFDDGFIIFDAGFVRDAPSVLPFRSESQAVRMAKAGGASLLLSVRLAGPENGKSYPTRARWTYRDILRESLLGEGVIEIDELDISRVTDAREICVLLGRAVAEAALSGGSGP